MRTYKYRLYPNKEQQQRLEWVLARCCELYNAALQERKEAWKYAKKSISYFEQCRSLTDIKNEVRPEYKDIGAHALQNVLKRIDLAYQAFYRRCKAGDKPGHPRYKSRHRYDSFCFPDTAGWKLAEKHLSLSKIGEIKIKLHRPVEGKIKTCSIKREGSHWYVCFACEVDVLPKQPYTDQAVGIDLGITHFAALSSGDFINNPRHFRRTEKKLAQLQQELARKKRRSNRRKKHVQRIAKAHRKVRNQRRDFHHQWSRRLVDTYETIVFEDLKSANMSKRPKPKQDEDGKFLPNGASAKAGLNKSILDAGWSQFVQYVTYKAESAGVSVVLVNPKHTSQICSGCGTVVKKDLSERWHSCQCGVELDRDINASLNILALGLKQ